MAEPVVQFFRKQRGPMNPRCAPFPVGGIFGRGQSMSAWAPLNGDNLLRNLEFVEG